MSIEVMRQALEVLEQINQLSVGENAIALPGEIDGAMDNLRAAIEQAEKPMAWFHADNYKTRFTTDPSAEMAEKDWKPLYTAPHQEQPLKFDPSGCHIRVGEVSEPISVGYDQTSLELCEECGWKAVIPGDGCLVCARQKAKPVAWMYDFLADDRDEVIRDWVTQSQDVIKQENGFNVRPLYTAPPAAKPLRWVDTIIPGDRVIDNDDKTQARVSKLIRKRPAAPDYFKLEFDDGSYIDVTDNELIANYKPLPESQKPVAYVDERIHGWPDCFLMEPDPPHTVPLYTAPRQWVGLTNKDIIEMWPETSTVGWDDIRLIEAKLKEKNAP
jgi:hypothetical protein